MATIITTGGGGADTIGEIHVQQYEILPEQAINNEIAVITPIAIPKYTIDVEQPLEADTGDVFIKTFDNGKIISEPKENKGTLFVRVQTAYQYGLKGWGKVEAYVGINNQWINFSKKSSVFGFKINKNDSNPDTAITYTEGAEGYTPVKMDFSSGTFDYGSWKEFIEELATPVMLGYDGTEVYELNRENQRQKFDGTPSDIANASFNGNAMVRIKRLWVKRWEDTGYNYVNLTFDKPDESYIAYAFTNDKGIINEQMYIPMFRGWNDSQGRLRSLADKTPTASTTAEQEINATNKNGKGWYTNFKSWHDLRIDILKLLTRSLNDQTALGQGNVSGNSSPLTTGTLANYGAFFGFSDTTHQVKCLYSEVMWGDRYERMMGLCIKGNVARAKNVPPYNINGSGYSGIGTLPSGGYIKTMSSTNTGYMPTATGGSGSTYWCDQLYSTTGSNEYYALDSAGWGNGSYCGSGSLSCYDTASDSFAYYGASPYFIKS